MRRKPSSNRLRLAISRASTTDADVYVLKTGDTRREVAILAPVFNGDTIEVNDPFATLTLRIVGQDGPIVFSKANDVATITGRNSTEGVPVRRLAWTASVVQLFDREQREQVSASIRGNIESRAGSQLSAPLFALPQTVLAGRRKLYDRLGFAAACGDPDPRRRRRAGCRTDRIRNAVDDSRDRLEAGRLLD